MSRLNPFVFGRKSSTPALRESPVVLEPFNSPSDEEEKGEENVWELASRPAID